MTDATGDEDAREAEHQRTLSREHRRAERRRDLTIGVIAVGIGIAATAVSYSMAGATGTYRIYFVISILGVVAIVRGLMR